MITLYHNPHCSKSREALAITEGFAKARGLPLQVVDYKKTPLSLEQLRRLQRQLGVPVREMVRANEEDYAALNLEQADEETLLAALASHPHLLQRPVVVFRDQGMIARPPEQLPAWFTATK